MFVTDDLFIKRYSYSTTYINFDYSQTPLWGISAICNIISNVEQIPERCRGMRVIFLHAFVIQFCAFVKKVNSRNDNTHFYSLLSSRR